MVRNTSIARVLWVEGKDDSAVVQSLCAESLIPKVFEIQNKGGIENLLGGVDVELRRRGLECFGVVMDANSDISARWAPIRQALLMEGYSPVPDRPDPGGTLLLPPPDRPRFGVWIMPDNAAPGMLEDFTASLVPPGDFLWTYAADVIDGIPEEHRRFREVERPKAHIHTWLAWQEGPGSPMGQAITKGDLDADAPAAQGFVAWLKRLFVD